MEQFKLVTPEELEREAIAAYFNELSHEEAEVHGPLNLQRFRCHDGKAYNVNSWLESVEKARHQPTSDEAVPTETMFLVREYTLNYGTHNLLPSKHIIGMVNIRLALNYNLFNSDGHVNVSLIERYRSVRIEEVALYLALNVLHERGIEVTLMTPEISGVSKDACVDLGGLLLYQGYDDVHECDTKHYVIATDTEEHDRTFAKLIAG